MRSQMLIPNLGKSPGKMQPFVEYMLFVTGVDGGKGTKKYSFQNKCF